MLNPSIWNTTETNLSWNLYEPSLSTSISHTAACFTVKRILHGVGIPKAGKIRDVFSLMHIPTHLGISTDDNRLTFLDGNEYWHTFGNFHPWEKLYSFSLSSSIEIFTPSRLSLHWNRPWLGPVSLGLLRSFTPLPWHPRHRPGWPDGSDSRSYDESSGPSEIITMLFITWPMISYMNVWSDAIWCLT